MIDILPTMLKNRVLSVSELTHDIKQSLEGRFAHVCVKGEVSNFKAQASGHLYFSLKDNGAQISAVCFRGNASRLSRMPKAGDQIVVKGEISVYAPRGGYQIIVRSIEFAGTGELLLKLHALKNELHQLGYFHSNHKKPLPKYPKTIGVVTSPTGSVIQDIINVLKRRHAGFHLILGPAKVQGDGAAQEIAEAIHTFNKYKLADVLIVGRGGGSLEDLWPFNERCVADAIYHSEIPIIAAIGHETDVSIADFVADIRAPTPSAAAEVAIKEKARQSEFLFETRNRLFTTCSHLLKRDKLRLHTFQTHPLLSDPYALLSMRLQRCDEIKNALSTSLLHALEKNKIKLQNFKNALFTHSPQAKLITYQEKISWYQKEITRRLLHQIKEHKERIYHLKNHFDAVNPNTLLKQGYCIPFAEKGDSIIMSAHELKRDDNIYLKFHDGKILTKVQ